MDLTKDLEKNVRQLKSILQVDKSFDILERIIIVHDKKFYLFYLDGFVKDTSFEYVRRDLYNLKPEDFDKIHTAADLVERGISSTETSVESDLDKIITAILSGQTALFGTNFDQAIIIDLRTYQTRGVEEPDKEKVLRGAHDGFVETIVFNTSLIRRRIRDPHLVFEMYNIGKLSRTDVAIGYMSDRVNKKTLLKIRDYIDKLNIDTLFLGDQSLIEVIEKKSWINPYPKVRYTERPDVASAQLTEGDVVVIIDNTPSVLVLPSSIFSFMQSIDDYYMPTFTGNYLKMVRLIVMLANMFLTPLYVLMVMYPDVWHDSLQFLLPTEAFNVPIFVQFLIMEVAVDGLKIASLNTPSALGTSLSIIGGLILGDFAVQTGWFIPQTILYMAVVALSSFVQPSIELSYAMKFSRIILLICSGIWGIWGFVAGIVINIVIVATTKTFAGGSYLYPLVPFNWDALKHVLFRCHKKIDRDTHIE